MKTVRGSSGHRARPGQVDQYGNVIGNVYIRKVERKTPAGEQLDPHLSGREPFWTYDPKEFLQNPVYSRDFRAKNLEP